MIDRSIRYLGGAEVEEEDAVLVDLGILKLERVVNADSEFCDQPVCQNLSPPAVTPRNQSRIGVSQRRRGRL